MNYEQHAESGFTQMNREQLREALKTLGEKVSPNEGEEKMRARLCAHFGKAVEDAPAQTAAEKKASKGIPNLSTEGAYGGKWYTMIIRCNDEKITSCPVGCNGRYTNYALNERVRMPAPHYNVLKTRIGGKVIQHARFEPGTGQILGYDKTTARQQLYTLEEVQVDPATAHLPEDYVEFFQRLARAKDNFKAFDRAKLTFIHTILREHITADAVREMSDEELRQSVLRALGPEFDSTSDVEFDLSDVA